MLHTTFVYGLIGGVLIGFASLIAAASSGRVPGISGVMSKSLRSGHPDRMWALLLLLGIIVGAGVTFLFSEHARVYRPVSAWTFMALAGVLVGIGTRLGGGCTSGHGVCGLGMGSWNSLVATLVFIAAGVLTVLALRQVLGGNAL